MSRLTLTDAHRARTTQTEYVLFAIVVFTELTKIDHMSAKSVLKTEITQNVSTTRGIKLETHKVNKVPSYLGISYSSKYPISRRGNLSRRTNFELNDNEHTIL